jgi:uncharacterized protein (TIGR03083 family)
MNKTDLLDTLQTERAKIEALLARLTEAQMLQPGAQNHWSVKDIVAHLTVWERRGAIWIEAMARGETPQAPVPGQAWDKVDRLNEEAFEEFQHRSLAEVLADFQQSFPLLIQQVEALSDDVLRKAYQGAWTDNEPKYGWEIVAWRYKHYQSHGRHIQDWLRRVQTRS